MLGSVVIFILNCEMAWTDQAPLRRPDKNRADSLMPGRANPGNRELHTQTCPRPMHWQFRVRPPYRVRVASVRALRAAIASIQPPLMNSSRIDRIDRR